MEWMLSLVLLMSAMTVSADQPRLVEGNPSSPIKVVIFEDLQCSDCADFRQMLDKQILPKFASKAAFEHRDFPLPKHNWARKAAIASRHFQSISVDLAVKYRKDTMARQAEITATNFNENLAAFAKKNGADPAKALAALNDAAIEAAVEKDYKDGVARGVGRTPTVLVDGEPFIERFTFEEIAAAIEKATKDIK
jgi:protein-disulfide isomerase